ncbi:hypothetical protein DW888_09315 [Bacteroides nordii]|uniref:Uncharacterized protein n=1 Tax=Bacteroides nordii TaxID=291645 RepID=A0A413VQW8_9BACE|nr:hypothetical protein DW888_09315 [Bacteroides nordii]
MLWYFLLLSCCILYSSFAWDRRTCRCICFLSFQVLMRFDY